MVLADSTGRKLAPECVRICRDPKQVWAYVKSRDPELPTYASRRGFFADEFEALLSGLERFEAAPLDSLLDNPLANLDSGAVEAAWAKAVCKTSLDDAGEPYNVRDDLPKLYRKAAGSLTLAPSEYSDEQIRRILGGATSVVEGIGGFAMSTAMLMVRAEPPISCQTGTPPSQSTWLERWRFSNADGRSTAG